MKTHKIIEEDIKIIVNSLQKVSHLFSGKTVVITGGLGFLGTYLVETLVFLNENRLKKKCKIIVIDNKITASINASVITQDKHISFINHDVSNPLKIREPVDYILHAAGIASPYHYKKYPLETINAAVNGTKNMLELAREKRVKSIAFFSSSEIYGDPPESEIPTKETFFGNVSSIGPRSCYDESKRLGEALCMVYFNYYQTRVKIIRPFNVFGPGMQANDFRVIPRFMYSTLKNEFIPIHGNGKQTRTFCYISDAIVGFYLVLLKGKNGEVYNVGSNQKEISINKLAEVFKDTFEGLPKFHHVPYPKNYPLGEPKRRCPDVSKIKKELHYRPRVGLENGLLRTFHWCTDQWNL